MGTHPIFESDFDCLTDTVNMRRLLPLRKFNSVLLRQNSAKTLGYFKRSISPCAFVPQQECYVIERFGKFSRLCEGGIMWKIPLIDSISYVQVLKELVIEVDKQKTITKDNVTVDLNGVLYIKIADPKKASYGVDNAENAITAIAQTTMRSEIGKLTLDGLFSERDILNRNIVQAINDASEEWGMSALRYEIRDINIPKEIQVAMQKLVEAERTKRAEILHSEGVKQSQINEAEGKRQAQILASEASQIELINEARGQAEAVKLNAEAKALAIELIAAKLEGSAGSDAARFELAARYIEAFGEIASEGTTLILPADAGDVTKMVGTAVKSFEMIKSK